MTTSKENPNRIDIDADICNQAWIAFKRFAKHVWFVELGNPADTEPPNDFFEPVRVRFRAGERAPLPWTREEFIKAWEEGRHE